MKMMNVKSPLFNYERVISVLRSKNKPIHQRGRACYYADVRAWACHSAYVCHSA